LAYDDENVTVGKYLDEWLKGLKGSVRDITFDRYEIAVRVHIKPVLGQLKLKKLTPAHVASFYQDRLTDGCATASVNKLHATLRKALDQAVKWHLAPRNVAAVVKPPRPTAEEMQALSAEETRRFLKAAHGDKLRGRSCGRYLCLRSIIFYLRAVTVGGIARTKYVQMRAF
jgi:integrase